MCAPASPQPISCVSWCPWEADDISTSSWEQLIGTEGGPRRLWLSHVRKSSPPAAQAQRLSAEPPEDPGPGASPLTLPELLPARACCLGLASLLAHLQGFPRDKVTSWPEDHTD